MILRVDGERSSPTRWFHKTVRSHVRDQTPPVREVLVHAGSVPYLDTTAVAMHTELIAELSDAGIELDFARVTTSLHSDLERNGIVGLLGRGHFQDTVAARIADFLARDSEARTLRPRRGREARSRRGGPGLSARATAASDRTRGHSPDPGLRCTIGLGKGPGRRSGPPDTPMAAA